MAPVTKIIFTTKEKQLLVSLLKKEQIIEDKRTNKATNILKAEAWNRVKERYNNHDFVTKREVMQLRRCWEKIKWLRKNARSEENKIRKMLSSGSPTQNSDFVPGVDDVPDQVFEIPNTADSDPLFLNDRKNEIKSEWWNMETSQHSNSTSTTENDVISTRPQNISKETEQQKELYLIRRSILNIEKQIALENLRHAKETNRLKEEHQRATGLENLRHTNEINRLKEEHQRAGLENLRHTKEINRLKEEHQRAINKTVLQGSSPQH